MDNGHVCLEVQLQLEDIRGRYRITRMRHAWMYDRFVADDRFKLN